MEDDISREERLRYWLLFIDNPNNEELKKVYKRDSVFGAAKERYDELIADPAVLEQMRLYEEAEREYDNGVEDAGERYVEATKKNAKWMLENGYDIADISNITSLSAQQISKL